MALSGKGSHRGPKGACRSSQVQKTPKDPAQPTGFPQRESVFKDVSQKQTVIHPTLARGHLLAQACYLPPLAAGSYHNWGKRGAGGRQGFPATERVDIAPLHQLKPLAVLRQGSATLGPKEPFPGLGLEERHPSQVVRSRSDFLPQGVRVLPASHAIPLPMDPRSTLIMAGRQKCARGK